MPLVLSMAWDPSAWLWPVEQSSLGVPDRPLYQVKVTLLAGANPVTEPEINAESWRLVPNGALPLSAASGLSLCTVVAMVRLPLATVNGSHAPLPLIAPLSLHDALPISSEARKA